jgi:glycerol-3-phosphate dehydrogenase
MPRSGRQLPQSPIDLAVVGGGIHGLFAALEAAARGWRVALFEREDFGSGLSFNHQRTVHGGLRALQSGHLGKTAQQIAERRAWALMAPHLLRPLPFLFPTDTSLMRSRLAVGSALRVYDWVGRERNFGVPAGLHLPPSRLASRTETLQIFPGMADPSVTGGAIWYDYQVRHPDRLNWLVALAAERAGAQLFNHTEVVDLVREGGQLVGVRVRRGSAGDTADVPAARVLLCAGAGTPGMFARMRLGQAPPLVRASNLLMRRPALDLALAARGASGRMLTATPWSDCWLVGTFQSDAPVDASSPGPSTVEIDAMIDDANSAFPTLHVRPRDVLLVHSGLTPAVIRRGRAELLPDSLVIAHAADGHAGVFSVVGVKFTTARLTALEALQVMRLDGQRHHPEQPYDRGPQVLPHGTDDNADALLRAASMAANVALDEDVHAHLIDWYGTEAADVITLSAAASKLRRLAPASSIIDGEILYAVERSRATRLGDAVLRRTRLGTAGHPGRVALDAAADVMTGALGWSVEQRAAEIADVERRYVVRGPTP